MCCAEILLDLRFLCHRYICTYFNAFLSDTLYILYINTDTCLAKSDNYKFFTPSVVKPVSSV
jgi:hypothetical protein